MGLIFFFSPNVGEKLGEKSSFSNCDLLSLVVALQHSALPSASMKPHPPTSQRHYYGSFQLILWIDSQLTR